MNSVRAIGPCSGKNNNKFCRQRKRHTQSIMPLCNDFRATIPPKLLKVNQSSGCGYIHIYLIYKTNPYPTYLMVVWELVVCKREDLHTLHLCVLCGCCCCHNIYPVKRTYTTYATRVWGARETEFGLLNLTVPYYYVLMKSYCIVLVCRETTPSLLAVTTDRAPSFILYTRTG